MHTLTKHWQPAPLPLNEAARMSALKNLDILDTPREALFDDLALLAKEFFEVSIVTITLVDKSRQFFKACLGLDAVEASRSESFCSYAILREEPTVVLDALNSERFCTNPLVLNEPFVRFYAGAPLLTKEGFRIGTFCVVDQSPRALFSDSDLAALRRFAAQAAQLIEHRQFFRGRVEMADESVLLGSRLRIMLESIPEPVVFLSPTWEVAYVNQCGRKTLTHHLDGSLDAYDIVPAASGSAWQHMRGALAQKTRCSFNELRPDGTLWLIDVHPAMEGLLLFFTKSNEHHGAESLQPGENRLHQLVRSGNGIVWNTGAHEVSVQGTLEWRAFTGQTVAELKHDGWVNAVHPDDRHHTLMAIHKAAFAKQPCTVQHRIRRNDGIYRKMQTRAIPVLNDQGEITEWFGLHQDHTDHEELEAQLKQANERFLLATQAITAGVWDVDGISGSAYYSARWSEIVGLPAVDTYSTIEHWFEGIHPEDVQRCRALWDTLRHVHQPHAEWEFRRQHQDGSWRWLVARAVCQSAPDGTLLRATGSISDMTRDKVIDPLTGLRNRTALLDRLQWRIDWEPAQNCLYGVFVIGIDHFTRVNDSLGLQCGDQLLLDVGQRIGETVSSLHQGVVTRLVGDEFCVLVSSLASVEDAETLALMLDYLLKQPFEAAGQQLHIAASIGVAVGAYGQYQKASEVLADADVALHQAKRSGRAKYIFFSPAMREEAILRMSLENDLHRALRDHEFELHYQPKVEMDTRSLVGFEALVRWRHPKKGLIPPNIFIPLMEERGLIGRLGRWVGSKAVEQSAQWRDCGRVEPHVSMAINVASQQLNEPDLLEFLEATLKCFNVPPSCLVVEITESNFVEETPCSARFLNGVVDAGMGLDLDDFGTGYSSLSYLHRLPFTCVKIDRAFVNRIEEDPASANLVSLIVGLAKVMGMKVVAEGVERQEQVERLLAMGCTLAQGYLFSPPRPASALNDYLGSRCSIPLLLRPIVTEIKHGAGC